MGKRSSGVFFQNVEEQAKRAQESQRQAAELADNLSQAAQITTPVEQLQESMPQPTTKQFEPDVRRGPDPIEMGGPSQITPITETQVSPELEGELRNRTMIPDVQNIGIEPTTRGMVSPDRAVELGQEQLQDELVVRPGAFSEDQLAMFGEAVDGTAIDSDIANDDGMILLKNVLEAGANSFRMDAGKANIFGKQIDLVGVPEKELATDPDYVLRKYGDVINGLIKSQSKLDMSEDSANPNAEIRKEFGRAASLAVLFEVGNRLRSQANEIDDTESQRRFDDALDRTNIGKAIGQRIERFIYPTQMTDPTKEFKGETEGFGYNYRLTEEEQSILGQAVIQGFAHSPLFNWLQSYTVVKDGKPKNSFRTTRDGEIQLAKIRNSARQALGMRDADRPVSLIPTQGGRLRGEGAYTQKKITAQVKKNVLTDSAREAINALGNVAHTTSPHKVLLGMGMLNASRENRNGIFAKYLKQNEGYLAKKEAEFLRDYEAQAAKDATFTPEVLGYPSFEEAAVGAAQNVLFNHFAERQRTLLDGVARMGDAFYYGYTAINNSERLMISNDELNYQANKMARFIVDGAIPARFEKGSNSNIEKGFFRVLARSLVPDAGRMSVENQLAAFEERRDDFVKWGKQLLAYTKQNEGRLATAKENNLEGLPPLNISGDLESYFNDMGKDEFFFAIDALHELARYELATTGASFKTRVKAEVDGNSNGAVIQAMQMGNRELLSKGGVLYQDNADLEDIRYFVFQHLETHPEFLKELEIAPVFAEMKRQGKIKEFLKGPIMTSIYGKDPRFHGDTAKKFYDDNPDLFKNVELHPDSTKNRDMIIEELRAAIQFSLEQGLGGALENAAMSKRIGRIYNIAGELAIAETPGPKGFNVQSGGFVMKPYSEVTVEFGEGAPTRDTARITTFQRSPSALAEAKGKKIAPGTKNEPDMGSKLRNQEAVNMTQNIDASIAQGTVTEVIGRKPGTTVMQVYDAFMGDATSFPDLVDTANRQFYDVNTQYNMLEEKRNALRNLKEQVKSNVAAKAAAGEMFDIGINGEYRGMGLLIRKAQQIVNRDMANAERSKFKALARDSRRRDSALGLGNYASTTGDPGGNRNDKSQALRPSQLQEQVLISPAKFQKLFNHALAMLNVEADLDTMIREVNARRTELLREIKADAIRQYS
jgi:hypothetical protein